jgi:hypothetical protein
MPLHTDRHHAIEHFSPLLTTPSDIHGPARASSRAVPATVCDHEDKDSKKTETGFFAGPFNSLCSQHHNSTRQREEKRGHKIGCDEDGIPLDAGHHWNKG